MFIKPANGFGYLKVSFVQHYRDGQYMYFLVNLANVFASPLLTIWWLEYFTPGASDTSIIKKTLLQTRDYSPTTILGFAVLEDILRKSTQQKFIGWSLNPTWNITHVHGWQSWNSCHSMKRKSTGFPSKRRKFKILEKIYHEKGFNTLFFARPGWMLYSRNFWTHEIYPLEPQR